MTLRLSANLQSYLDWEQLDSANGLATVTDEGEIFPAEEWSYGTGDGKFVNDGYFVTRTIGPGVQSSINFIALPRTMLGIRLTRFWRRVKVLCIENLTASGYLDIGSSGLANDLQIMSTGQQIGPSGVYTFSSEIGFGVNSTRRNLRIINTSDHPMTYKVFALGTK